MNYGYGTLWYFIDSCRDQLEIKQNGCVRQLSTNTGIIQFQDDAITAESVAAAHPPPETDGMAFAILGTLPVELVYPSEEP